MKTNVLLVRCPDQLGIISKISQCLFDYKANIIEADQHTSCIQGGEFFLRIEFCFDESQYSSASIQTAIQKMAQELKAKVSLHDTSEYLRTSILLSHYDHGLAELLYLWKNKELPIEITSIISNHDNYGEIAKYHDIPFHFVLADPKENSEAQILDLVQDNTDFLILARYMQIISESFLNNYGKNIINIHHSFLPSFKGADPYRQALERGVKVIGATAHFVTTDLDEGPIIAQKVENVTHRDCLDNLKQKGRILEKHTLAQAVSNYAEHRIISCKNKTIVFS
jgi:formyltetrahydrofolate deformylase